MKLNKKDADRQKEIEKRVEIEKVILDNPKGKEKFDRVVKLLGKKKHA